jgi:hypothetical protein
MNYPADALRHELQATAADHGVTFSTAETAAILAQLERGIHPSIPTAQSVASTRSGRRRPTMEWQSLIDPDSSIARMKDGTTHLDYKAEYAVDLDPEFVLAASALAADQADRSTLVDRVLLARVNLVLAGGEQEAVADKGSR